jgi:putative hydrolase of the HAD superfamily
MSLFDVAAITAEEYKARVLENLPKSLHGVALKAATYHISALPFMCGMEELLSELKSLGYRLFITSNMDSYHAAQMKDTPAAKYFDGMIFSGDIKVGKPEEEFFRIACEKFATDREQTVFIDDLEDNVRGAAGFGIKGLVFGGNPNEIRAFIRSFEE